MKECIECWSEFNPKAAKKIFDEHFHGEYDYYEETDEELCGVCAIEHVEEKYDQSVFNCLEGIPECCRACGGNYPECQDSCSLFDD